MNLATILFLAAVVSVTLATFTHAGVRHRRERFRPVTPKRATSYTVEECEREMWYTTEEMNSSEYQAFYDTGMMPARFWPDEIRRLSAEYAADKLTQEEFEHSLEALMGLRT